MTVVPIVPRCIPLTKEARYELEERCSIPNSDNPQAVMALCPNLESWLGDLELYCEAIDILSGG